MRIHMLRLRAGTAARAAVLALSCALAMLVAAPRVACAQGTSGAFADPISIGELKMLLEQRGDVPSGAWPQIQAAHDAYLRRAEEFRNGDIEKFQRKSRAAGSQSDPASQVAEWQALMREYAELNRKFDSIDEALFIEVATAIESSPEAAEAVEGAKLARRRHALRMGFGRAMMSSSVMADVEQVAFDLPVPDAARAGVRQAIAGYGRKQTPLLREYGDRVQQMYLEFMKAQVAATQAAAARGEAGGQDGAAPIGEGAGQEAWGRLGPEITRQRKQLLANNRDASRAVREALAANPEAQQRFADQWVVASYPSIPDSESTGVPQAGRRALRVRGLDEAARASVKQAIADWRAADEALVTEWSAVTEEFEATVTPWTFDDAAYRSFSERVGELQRRRMERATQALSAIDAAVGADLAPIVRGADLSRDGEVLEPERADADVPAAGASAGADQAADVGGIFKRMQRKAVAGWSAAFGVEDVALIAAAIAADDGQRAILESLAADHAAGWAARVDPIFVESQRRMDQFLNAKEFSKLSDEVHSSIDAARIRRDALDAEFFDAVAAAVASGPDAARAVASLRQLREIDGVARDEAARLTMRMGEPVSVRTDPLVGVWPLIAAERRAELLALLEARVPAARQAAAGLAEASRALKETDSRMHAMTADMPEPEKEAIYSESARVIGQVSKACEALRAADEAIAEGALALLADDARARVRLQHIRAKHPEYFREDPAQRAFDRALALEGIDDALRNSITAALTEYLAARDASEVALVQAVGARTDYPVFDDGSPEAEARFAKQYEAWMLGNEKVERALYVRRGGRERALVALSGILGPDRAKAVRVPDAAELAREEARLRDGSAADSDE